MRAYTYPRRGLSRMINDGAETTAGRAGVVPGRAIPNPLPQLFTHPARSRRLASERLTNQPQR